MPHLSPDHSYAKGDGDLSSYTPVMRDLHQGPANKISIEIAVEDLDDIEATFLEALLYIRGKPYILDGFVRAEDQGRGCSYTDMSDLTLRDLPEINEWIHEMEEDAKSLNVKFVLRAEVSEWLERLVRLSKG